MKHFLLKKLPAILLVAMVSGCGGGGESSSNNTGGTSGTGGTVTPQPQVNTGGQPSSPSDMSYTLPNVISSDSFNNYFKVTVNSGDSLIINVDLDNPLTALDVTRCLEDPKTKVHASLDNVRHFCAYDLFHTFEKSGTYVVRFQYPLQRAGTFNASLMMKNSTYGALPANGSGGTPTQPRQMSFSSDNKISKLGFFNNYQFTGNSGDKLVFHTMLNAPLASNAVRRCKEGDNYEGHHSLGVSVNFGKFSCEERTEFVLPSSGTYNFNIRYMSVDNFGKIDGAFRVDLIR